MNVGDVMMEKFAADRSTNPHKVTRDFEKALCEYTGARYAVAVNSCTMALTLAVAWQNRLNLGRGHVRGRWNISIPKRTYVSVPMAIIHAGCWPVFDDRGWLGWYRLEPLPVWDSARWFTSGMYKGYTRFGAPFPGWQQHATASPISVNWSGHFVCLSFHAAKILGDTQGGAILHDNAEADAWFRRARFDGRAEGVAPKDDKGIILGWHCYMSPDVSVRLLNKLTAPNFPRHNDPLPNDDYPELDQLECFK